MFAMRMDSFRAMIACYLLDDRDREQALAELDDIGSDALGHAVAWTKIVGRSQVERHYRERLAQRLHRIEE